jgi:antitoxin component YwqK of YwqJK toxin-antitoxin module
MSATNIQFRFLGVLVVILTGLIARADGKTELHLGAAGTAQAQAAASSAALPAPVAKDAVDNVAVAPVPDAAATADTKVELVTERYPNGSVKVEREVTRDANGNYVNQGTYKEYDLDGKVRRTGEFVGGKQQGKWTQTFAKDEGHLFSADHDTAFSGPFTSEATFVAGQLHGAWTIKDGKGRNVVAWDFDNGVRNGKWTWWYPNGEKRLEANFKHGNLDEEVLEYGQDGQQASKETYLNGMRLTKTVGWYTLGQKHFEGYYLRVSDMPEATYDWWKGTVTVAPAKAAEKELKHGAWIEWYQSGNKKSEFQYDHGVSTGRFVWWYENGQKQAEVDYHAGLLGGTWVTWHANGQKESQAKYRDGVLVDPLLHWNAEGKLVETRYQPAAQQAEQTGNANRTTNRQSPAGMNRSR